MNSPPAREERDCHDPVIGDSKSKKENAVDGVGGLQIQFEIKKKIKSYAFCRIHIKKKICLEAIKLVSYEFRNLNKTC